MDKYTITSQEIERLESLFQKYSASPKKYETILLIWCICGIIIALLVFFLLIYLFYLSLSSFFLITAIVLFWGVITSTRASVPYSVKLKRKDFPGIYRKVNYIAHILRAPKVSVIYLTNEYNASVAQVFPFIPGLRIMHLHIGYPLLCALDGKSVISTLAHEFGHLSKDHSLKSRFILIAMNFWENTPLFITILFFPWRFIFLKATRGLSAFIRRHWEAEADQFGTKIYGAEGFGRVLLLMMLKGGRLPNEYRKRFASTMDEKDFDFCKINREILTPEISEFEITNELPRILQQEELPTEEHPPLKKRLEALGIFSYVDLLHDTETSASVSKFFGSKQARMEKEINIQASRMYSCYLKTYKDDFKFLEKNRDKKPVLLDEFIVRVDTLGKVGRYEDAYEICKEGLAKYFDSPELLFFMSHIRMLLRIAPEQSIPELEKFLEEGHFFAMYAYADMFDYFLETGDLQRLKKLVDMREKLRSNSKKSSLNTGIDKLAENKNTDEKYSFEPPPDEYERYLLFFRRKKLQTFVLSEDLQEMLETELFRYPFIKKAYAVYENFEGRKMRMIVFRIDSFSVAPYSSEPAVKDLSQRFILYSLGFKVKIPLALLRITGKTGFCIYNRRDVRKKRKLAAKAGK